MKLDGDRISEITFEGAGCAISKSSASVMTTVLKGKTVKEAEVIFKDFHQIITSAPDAPVDEAAVGKLRIFSGVREFPCASSAPPSPGTP